MQEVLEGSSQELKAYLVMGTRGGSQQRVQWVRKGYIRLRVQRRRTVSVGEFHERALGVRSGKGKGWAAGF